MLMEMLYATARNLPRHPAIACGEERLTYADLVDRIERLARGLVSMGVGPSDRIALVLPNGPPFVISFFAAAGMGAVAAPLNPQFTEKELAGYFRHCGIRAVITDHRSARRCQAMIAGWE